ncbi:MAG TPA: dienelactone hydrolase family protein [Stellaceae bacterium]|nr:dienelactone hydrolase family protein [Stellaceae bacterium]
MTASMIALRRCAAAGALILLAGCGGAGGIAASGLVKQAIASGGEVSGSFPVEGPNGAIEIPFQLLKPEGAGPFPAVVILHDCSGLGRRSSGSPARWARKLVPQGYVVILPDSFTPRGFPEGVCTISQSQAASPFVRAGDASAALAYLRRQPYVAGNPVGVMGGSHGGSSTLATMVDKGAAPGSGFAAAIALYPGCGANYGAWRAIRRGPGGSVSFTGTYKPAAPLLILIGEKDDWTPAPFCQSLADAAQQAGYPVALKIYPGAMHSFDSNARLNYNPERNNPNKPEGRGATVGGDPTAWADAEQRVAAFFGKYLKGAN